jgi:NADP-dependent 3-hydroxy acid dehydrogenase YdfG
VSSGIGRAPRPLLVRRRDHLTLAARRGDQLEVLAASLPGDAAWIAADVSRREDVAALAALAEERFGRIDGIVCNAGIMPSSPLGARRVNDWNCEGYRAPAGVRYPPKQEAAGPAR